MPKRRALLILVHYFSLIAVVSHAQSDPQLIADFNPDNNSMTLERFLAAYPDYESQLRQDECEILLSATLSAFRKELHYIDSLCSIQQTDSLPYKTTAHQYVLFSKRGHTSGVCLKMMYADKKVFPGCKTAAVFDSENLNAYPHLNQAVKDNKICINIIRTNAFVTQVEELPTETYSAQTAENLLILIERTLKTYYNQLNYSFTQYQTMEQNKAPAELTGLIDFRTRFLSHCKNKIKNTP
jgi:hypothetical protein